MLWGTLGEELWDMEGGYWNKDAETGVGNYVIIRALSNTAYRYADVPFVA